MPFTVPVPIGAPPVLRKAASIAVRSINSDLRLFPDAPTVVPAPTPPSVARTLVPHGGDDDLSVTMVVYGSQATVLGAVSNSWDHGRQLGEIFGGLNWTAHAVRWRQHKIRERLVTQWRQVGAGPVISAAHMEALLRCTDECMRDHRAEALEFWRIAQQNREQILGLTGDMPRQQNDHPVCGDPLDNPDLFDQKNLRSILADPSAAGDDDWVTFKYRMRELIGQIPPDGGSSGYGNIPAGVSGVLENIYDSKQSGRYAAFIGDSPEAGDPRSWYTPYATAAQLGALHDRSGVRALVLTDLHPAAQPDIDRYLHSAGTDSDKQALTASLRSNFPDAGCSSGGDQWWKGMVKMVDTARENGINVIAQGIPQTVERDYRDVWNKAGLLDVWNRAREQTGGNVLFYGGRGTLGFTTESLGLVSIRQYDPLDDQVFAGDGFVPLRVEPGQIQYGMGAAGDPPSFEPLDRGMYLWNTFPTGM